MRRVLIIDDSEIFRRSLRNIVNTDDGWEICGEAENADKGARLAVALKPDVVLMDLSMPGMSGAEAIQHIRSKVPASRIVILSLHTSEQLVYMLLRAGARGYVVKSRADSDVIDAMNAVMQGETYCSSSVVRARATGA